MSNQTDELVARVRAVLASYQTEAVKAKKSWVADAQGDLESIARAITSLRKMQPRDREDHPITQSVANGMMSQLDALAAEMASLRAELAEARKDTALLDWLFVNAEEEPGVFSVFFYGEGYDYRAAIAAARAKGGP